MRIYRSELLQQADQRGEAVMNAEQPCTIAIDIGGYAPPQVVAEQIELNGHFVSVEHKKATDHEHHEQQFPFAQATVLVRGIPPGYDKEQTLAEIFSARLMTIGNGESLSAARVVQCTICQRTTTFVRYAFLLKQTNQHQQHI